MAVYTKVSEAQAAEFLRAYDCGALKELAGIEQGVENTNYRLRTAGGRFILTLYEKRVKREDLPFFLGLMEHLAKKGVPCPQPVRARDGKALQNLAGHPAALTGFLEGEAVHRAEPAHCAAVGRALAGLHEAGRDFPMRRANALSLPAWHELAALCRSRADEVQPGLAALLAAELAYMDKHWPKDLPRGVIHADLFHDNVHFRDRQLTGLIDFYFACEDFFAYDLAIGLNAWCFEDNAAFRVENARALLRGYGEKRVLSDREKTALPVLARGAALRFLLTRLYDWLHPAAGALVKAKDPLEYLTRLHFHRQSADAAVYGIDP